MASKLYGQRIRRSNLVRKYILELEYSTSFDSKQLEDTFLNPLKRKSKRGRVLYSKRDSAKITSFYKAIKRKQQAKQRVIVSFKKGVRKQSISYWIPKSKSSKKIVPYSGKMASKIEGVIQRRKHSLALKKFGKGGFKDIQKNQNLSKNQLKQFKRLLGAKGFDKKGKMSKEEGYLYRLWIQKNYGEDYVSDSYSYGSSAMSDFQSGMSGQSEFDFTLEFIKENYD